MTIWLLWLLGCSSDSSPPHLHWQNAQGEAFTIDDFRPLEKDSKLMLAVVGPGELKVNFDAGIPDCLACKPKCMVEKDERVRWHRRWQLEPGPQLIDVGATVPDWRLLDIWVSAVHGSAENTLRLRPRWCEYATTPGPTKDAAPQSAGPRL